MALFDTLSKVYFRKVSTWRIQDIAKNMTVKFHNFNFNIVIFNSSRTVLHQLVFLSSLWPQEMDKWVFCFRLSLAAQSTSPKLDPQMLNSLHLQRSCLMGKISQGQHIREWKREILSCYGYEIIKLAQAVTAGRTDIEDIYVRTVLVEAVHIKWLFYCLSNFT